MVKPSHGINNGSHSKMGFTKIGDKWVSKEEECVGPFQTKQMMDTNLHQMLGINLNMNKMIKALKIQLSKFLMQPMELLPHFVFSSYELCRNWF